jgi:hypothetical protein
MADEITPDPVPSEVDAPTAVSLRVNGSSPFKRTIANAIGGKVNTPMNLTTQYISLHTGDPGSTGASEVTGGGYARLQVTWATAVDDTGGALAKGKITGGALAFNVPAATISHYGVWNVATGAGDGTTTGYMYGKTLSATVALSVAGKVTVTPTHAYGLLA